MPLLSSNGVHAPPPKSLDGYIARQDGGIDWLLARDDPAEDHGYRAFIKSIDAIVMGAGVLRQRGWPGRAH